MSATFTESVVEQAALAWLAGLGYDVISGPDIAPDQPGAERDDYSQVVLDQRRKEWIVEQIHSVYAVRALDWFFSQPIFTPPDFVASSRIPKPTAHRIVRMAREQGLLKALRSGKGRQAAVLAFPELLNIAEGREVL
jgi:hypothetical protein